MYSQPILGFAFLGCNECNERTSVCLIVRLIGCCSTHIYPISACCNIIRQHPFLLSMEHLRSGFTKLILFIGHKHIARSGAIRTNLEKSFKRVVKLTQSSLLLLIADLLGPHIDRCKRPSAYIVDQAGTIEIPMPTSLRPKPTNRVG